MAEHDLKITVSADTSDAKKKLEDVGKVKVGPVKVDVTAEKVKIDAPKVDPVKVDVVQPETVRVDVEKPAPVEVAVEPVKPVKVPVEKPNPATVDVTVAVNDEDLKRRLSEISKEHSIKVSAAGFSQKDGEKFKVEFKPDDTKVKNALREITASEHSVIVGIRAKWDVAQNLYAELQKPIQKRVSEAVKKIEERIPAMAASSSAGYALPPSQPPPPPTPSVDASQGPKKNTEEVKKLIAAMDDAGESGKKASEKTKTGFEQATGAINKSYYALRSIQRLAVGMGLAAAIVGFISRLQNLVESFKRAKKHADELFEIQSRLADERRVATLANEYNALSDAIKSAADQEKHLLGMIDLEVEGRRKLEKAKMDAAEQREISSLDAKDPNYRKRSEEISRRYSEMRNAKDASNQVEDLVLKRQKNNALADQTDQEAKAQDAKTAEIRARIQKATRERDAALAKSLDTNDADKNGYLDSIAKTTKQIFTLNWGRALDKRTDAGDAIRKEQAQTAANKDLEVQKLEEELRKSMHAAEEIRKKAARIRERSVAMGSLIEAARTNLDTTAKKNETTEPQLNRRDDAKVSKRMSEHKEKLAKNAEKAVLDAAFGVSDDRGRIAILRKREEAARAEMAKAEEDLAAELRKEAQDRDNAKIADLSRRSESAQGEMLSAISSRIEIASAGNARAASVDAVSQNRLTAMGLGSGVSATGVGQTDVRRIIDLLREQIKATKDIKPVEIDTTATFTE